MVSFIQGYILLAWLFNHFPFFKLMLLQSLFKCYTWTWMYNSYTHELSSLLCWFYYLWLLIIIPLPPQSSFNSFKCKLLHIFSNILHHFCSSLGLSTHSPLYNRSPLFHLATPFCLHFGVPLSFLHDTCLPYQSMKRRRLWMYKSCLCISFIHSLLEYGKH